MGITIKSKILTGLLTGLAVSASTIALFCQPSRAGNNSFFCATLNRQPVTLVRTPRGNVPLVRWTSNNLFSAAVDCSKDAAKRWVKDFSETTTTVLSNILTLGF